jgi:hypothetical protein
VSPLAPREVVCSYDSNKCDLPRSERRLWGTFVTVFYRMTWLQAAGRTCRMLHPCGLRWGCRFCGRAERPGPIRWFGPQGRFRERTLPWRACSAEPESPLAPREVAIAFQLFKSRPLAERETTFLPWRACSAEPESPYAPREVRSSIPVFKSRPLAPREATLRQACLVFEIGRRKDHTREGVPGACAYVTLIHRRCPVPAIGKRHRPCPRTSCKIVVSPRAGPAAAERTSKIRQAAQ